MVAIRCATLLLGLILLSACSTSNTRPNASSGKRNVITYDEIRRVRGQTSAYGVVAHLRPFWLRTRGSHSMQGHESVVVYVDGMRVGGPAELQFVSASIVREMRYLSAREANLEYGAGHVHGAILLATQRGAPPSD